MPPQLVLSEEKSGGADTQQSLYGIALSEIEFLSSHTKKKGAFRFPYSSQESVESLFT